MKELLLMLFVKRVRFDEWLKQERIRIILWMVCWFVVGGLLTATVGFLWVASLVIIMFTIDVWLFMYAMKHTL